VDLYAMLGAGERAIAVALECLQHVGIDWSLHPTAVETRSEYERIWSLLGDRAIEGLIDLPLMQDAEAVAMLEVLLRLSVPAMYIDANLCALSHCRAANLSLEHGNSDTTPAHYGGLAMVASSLFGHYDEGYRFGKLACNLLERRRLSHFGGQTYFRFAVVVPWTRPLGQGIDPARHAFETAKEYGDPAFAAHACRAVTSILFALGHPLDQVEREAEHGLEFVRRFGFFLDRISPLLALARTLRGTTAKLGSLDDGRFTERSFEERATGEPSRAFLECYYWIRKLQARFFAGDYLSATEAAEKAATRYAACASLSFFLLEKAEFHFYAALSRAALCEPMGPDSYAKHREALGRHERELRAWAANCPQNFEDRAALVGAEIARIEGRPLDAMGLYERAIASARANGFVHNEALAYELAACFYAARGFEDIAHLYLKNARHCYLRWGADGKVRQLDQLHPWLRQDERAAGPTATIEAPVEQLDLATVLKVSQAVSGEMVLEKLIDRLMRAAIEQAGAERALLISPCGKDFQIEAEAITSAGDITVQVRDSRTPYAAPMPETLIRYAMRTQETVILDDASSQNSFASDPYIVQRRARSILCLALINQGKFIGILYLENNMTPRVFTPDRIAVLKVLASQAAISLENTRLYRDVEDREGKIRRLVDANIIGIFVADIGGPIVEANDAFLRIVGYDREDLALSRVSRMVVTPPEWRERDMQALAELTTTGTFQPFEKEYFRKDGKRVPVLVGGTLFKKGGNEAVAFVLDLTERKRAEEALRELESDFARMNRVSIMGELAASLAHEIAQPIGSARNNARAAQNFLDMLPPRLDKVREALSSVVGNTDRAGDIIERIREQVKKTPPQKGDFDLNAAIDEVMVLARSVVIRNGVSVQTRLADGLFPIHGDRVQLQQVILNLILNAVEAMGSVEMEPRDLLISTEQDHTGVLVAVRDTGPGIDPEHLERVFEAFYTTKSSGVGMGLSICRSIIDAHGGRLWAEANEPRGAVFQFTLPGAEVS
jgi:PAS domain S-box-containing protein